jgi:hypothetical protein
MELWKYGGEKLKENLLKLFNHIWEQGKIVGSGKSPYHKNGSKYEYKKSRGITLLVTASYRYAHILKNRLKQLRASRLHTEAVDGEKKCSICHCSCIF